MLQTILIILLALVLFILGILLLRTARFPMRAGFEEPLAGDPTPDADGERVAAHLGRAVQLASVSNLDDPNPFGKQAILSLHALLETLYPRVHATLNKEVIAGYSLLYTWEGAQAGLAPALFMAHLDVVPADEAPHAAVTEELRAAIEAGTPGAPWKYPPFSGKVADGFVWGRGTSDDKCGVIGVMEAAEALLRAGFRPERTIYFAFGHDEEIGGLEGARSIAALLQSRGVRLYSVIDEGGMVGQGVLPGIKTPVALVGTAEKGYLGLELSVESAGGHSSVPPAHTAIGILAAAITRVEAHPSPPHLEPVLPMLRFLGSEFPLWIQLPLANLWLSGGLIKRILARSPLTNAIIRTTRAVTMVHGGVKDNVLPPKASAVINLRILPGDSLRAAYERVARSVADPRVSVRPARGETLAESGWEPTPASSLESRAFRRLAGVIQAHYPQAVLAPFLMMGATDSRYMAPLCDSVYRFAPFFGEKDELNRAHGTNERLSLANCAKMVAFYADAIKALSRE
jgi:carboxypeptidase PM20D1